MRTTRTLLQESFTVPKSTTVGFIHRLRAILREITYIPDPFARQYHHGYIFSQFRQFFPKTSSSHAPNWHSNHKYIINNDHLLRCYKKCREKLWFYRRAGGGDHTALKRALWLAYGRSGKRKHTLLAPYLLPDVPKNAQAIEKAFNASKTLTLDLPSSISAILKQQGNQPGTHLSTLDKNVRQFFEPVLKEKNIWDRPVAENRIANKKKELMSALISKIYAPLPHDEFTRLERLAQGDIPCPRIPKRRKRLSGLRKLDSLESVHKITPRTMRRMWAQILPFCYTIRHDTSIDRWVVTWGSAVELPLEGLKDGDRTMLSSPSTV